MLFKLIPSGEKWPLGSAIKQIMDEKREDDRRKRIKRFRQARERFGVEVLGVVYLPCTREVEKFLYDEL